MLKGRQCSVGQCVCAMRQSHPGLLAQPGNVSAEWYAVNVQCACLHTANLPLQVYE